MAAPVDPLAWINENPVLLAIGGPIAVSAISLFFKAARRWWGKVLRTAGRTARFLVSLRLVTSERVRPSRRQLQRTQLAPVRWAIRYRTTSSGGTEAMLANSASGVAQQVRVDDGAGTTVFGDATWSDVPRDMGGVFTCWIDELTALGGSATFLVSWTDALGQQHRQYVDAHPGAWSSH